MRLLLNAYSLAVGKEHRIQCFLCNMASPFHGSQIRGYCNVQKPDIPRFKTPPVLDFAFIFYLWELSICLRSLTILRLNIFFTRWILKLSKLFTIEDLTMSTLNWRICTPPYICIFRSDTSQTF